MQHQDHERQELREANQSQVERVVRRLVDLEAHRHGLHLDRNADQEAGAQITPDIGVGQGGETR